MSLANNLKTYFRRCPLVDNSDRFNFNYLGAESTEYAIFESPSEEITRKYIDGSTVREKTLIFASRKPYGDNVRTNISNSGFFEDFAAWVELQNKSRNLPAMRPNQTPQKLEVTTSGYVLDADSENARIQIQLKLTYYQKGA